MNAPSTDVSSAQSFDVSSFLGSLVNTAGQVITAKISPTQNTGQPAVTTSPDVRAGLSASQGGGAVAGMSQQTLMMVGIGAALLVAVVLLKK